MEIHTIGFTEKSAAEFFGRIRDAGVRRLVDIRLRTTSQLAGFAKGRDLAFFLPELCNAEYVHEPLLAPTAEIMDAFKKHKGPWDVFERDFNALLAERRVEERLDPDLFAVPSVLLCSEAGTEHCHRRLVVEYLDKKWGNVTAVHL